MEASGNPKVGAVRRRLQQMGMLHRRLQQLELVIEEHGPDAVEWDSDQPENFTYLYDPAWLLVRAGEEENVRRTLAETEELLDDWSDPEAINSVAGPLPLSRLRLPERRDGDPRRVQLAMDALDRAELNVDGQRQVATPEHWVHLSPGGTGRLCPATEPAPADPRDTWPVPAGEPSVGAGARVVVVDSGWHPPAGDPAGPTPWLDSVTGTDEGNVGGQPLRPYAGHGTFIAGTVRSIARGAEIWVERFFQGSALREVDMVLGLLEAFEHAPNLINLSAGCTSRKDRPLLSFEVFYEFFFSKRDDCLLVAAAGNDGVPDSFWPASFDWAIGVGSLDRDGSVSSFSNYGDSADVYAVGRNLVNAYPGGTYTCREVPHTGDQREFKAAARWSGTSFAAPVVVGLIAAELGQGGDVNAAWSNVRGRTTPVPGHGGAGTVDSLLPPYT